MCYNIENLTNRCFWVNVANETILQIKEDTYQQNQEEYTMTITDVWVRKVTKEGKLKAIVSITLDDEFVVHDIKVIEGEKGLFIAMPSKKATDGEFRDIAHPINSSTREKIQSIILDKYQQSLDEE